MRAGGRGGNDFTETTQFVRVIIRGTAAHRILGRLREMELDTPRTIDIAFLTEIGSIGRVREFMPAASPWARLFEAARMRPHSEITLEFLCTFAFTDTGGSGLQHFLSTTAVSFTLCRESHRMTLT
ncbi:hypothetical protein Hanom_Chr03g00182721 [Helianthus anomalus]